MRLGKRVSKDGLNDAIAHDEPAVVRTVEDDSVLPGGTRLGERLVQQSLLTPEDVTDALYRQVTTGARIGQLLVEQGTLDERDLARTLAVQCGLEFVDLRTVAPDPKLATRLPESVAREYGVIPMLETPEGLIVAVSDPTEESVAKLAAAADGVTLLLWVGSVSEISRAIESTYRATAAVGAQVEAFKARDVLRRAASNAEKATANDDAPVVQVVNALITQGLRDRASDIHIEPQAENVRVRYRIDGALHEVLTLPASIGPALVSRIKIMGSMNIVERRRPQDGQIAMDLEDRAVDIRVSTTATIWGEKVVMRLLDKSRPLFRLAELGMPADTAERYSKLIHSPYGMVMCAGPTGSGKTTTLYGSLGEINSPDRNIMTIEDPVEYTFPSINQIQINEQAGITFAGGLKSILRQDPDVILVGEVRDVDTARIAVQSALTGHFVLSSLHATDSVSALHRLIDMGIETFLVASSLSAVVAQRLVRRICGYCRTAYTPHAEELAFFQEVGGRTPSNGFWRGAGCNFCAQTGYQERIGVYELLIVDDDIKALVVERTPHEVVRRTARANGMRTLTEEAVRLIEEDVTTIAEVVRSVYMAGG